MREIHIEAVPLEPLSRLLDSARVGRLEDHVTQARRILGERVVWNVSATASGGGVAEMLAGLLGYTRGVGVDTRWLILDGNPRFFRITKRLHNVLHGMPGDSGPLGDTERDVYEEVLAGNLQQMRTRVRAGDIVLLHDPQTAGLVPGLSALGAHVIWRCHIGRDESNEHTDRGWIFLEPYLADAEATVFTRDEYVPRCVDRRSSRIIPPSLDPFSAKNVDLSPADVDAALRHAGLVVGGRATPGRLAFVRRDGTGGTVRSHSNLTVAGGPVPASARVVLQVSRWDRLKDMTGVLTSFSTHLQKFPDDAHLLLVGPDAMGVSDDPEGAEVLFECVDAWKDLPAPMQDRVHLISLPMDDVDENAHLTNALQRHASVVVQKSLVEGFGLTVTEAMWKSRPVVASAVGGIQDQVIHGKNGLLLREPADGESFANLIATVLHDDQLARRLGAAATASVRDRYLADRHLSQYVDLFTDLLRA